MGGLTAGVMDNVDPTGLNVLAPGRSLAGSGAGAGAGSGLGSDLRFSASADRF